MPRGNQGRYSWSGFGIIHVTGQDDIYLRRVIGEIVISTNHTPKNKDICQPFENTGPLSNNNIK